MEKNSRPVVNLSNSGKFIYYIAWVEKMRSYRTMKLYSAHGYECPIALPSEINNMEKSIR